MSTETRLARRVLSFYTINDKEMRTKDKRKEKIKCQMHLGENQVELVKVSFIADCMHFKKEKTKTKG